MYSQEEMPQYVDFPDPVVQNEDEVLVSVKAVALKHLDKSRAKGTHYSTSGDQGEAKIVGWRRGLSAARRDEGLCIGRQRYGGGKGDRRKGQDGTCTGRTG